jgi:hypothetical protein
VDIGLWSVFISIEVLFQRRKMYSHSRRKKSIKKTSKDEKSDLGGKIISLEVARSDNLIAVSKSFLAQFQLEPSSGDLTTKTWDYYDDDYELSLGSDFNEGIRSKSQDYLESLSTREVGMSESFFMHRQSGVMISKVSDFFLDVDKRETERALDIEVTNLFSEEDRLRGSPLIGSLEDTTPQPENNDLDYSISLFDEEGNLPSELAGSSLIERMEDTALQPGNNDLDDSISLFDKDRDILCGREGSKLKPDNHSTPVKEDISSQQIDAVHPISFSLFDSALNDAGTALASQGGSQVVSDRSLSRSKTVSSSPGDSYAQYLKTHLLVRPPPAIRASLLQGTAASRMRLSALPLHSKAPMAADGSQLITSTPPRPRRNSNPTSNIVYGKQLSPQKRVSLPSLIPPSLLNTPQVSCHHLHISLKTNRN